MLTLPSPVAGALAFCHLSVAAALVATGAPWLAVFLVVAATTAALFSKRTHAVEIADVEE